MEWFVVADFLELLHSCFREILVLVANIRRSIDKGYIFGFANRFEDGACEIEECPGFARTQIVYTGIFSVMH